MKLVFLGMNLAGEKTVQWLRKRADAEIEAVITEKEELCVIEEVQPDLIISSGFEHIVPKKFLEVPEKGAVNLHPSLLPYNRGSHPYIWPIIEDTVAGVSVHYMNEKIDEGPVIDRKKVEKKPTDTGKTLHNRLMDKQFQLFKKVWPDLKRGVPGEQQDLSKGSYHISKDLEEIREIKLDEEVRTGELIDRLRALTYEDGTAYFEKNGKTYSVKVEIERY